MANSYQYGLLIPHFGSEASRDRLARTATDAEAFGFDSLWVRDHLIFHPHAHEDSNRTHVDPFMVLSFLAARTERITLAFGTLIPHRHPIHTALLLGCLDFLSGPGRIIAAWGLGASDHEFESIGLGHVSRRDALEEQIKAIRDIWTGESVDHHGEYYDYKDVQIAPVPRSPIPMWYGGNSAAAVRRAVEYCDGWIPGRTPRRDTVKLIGRMARLAEEAGKPLPTVGSIPLLSPGKTVEEGYGHINMQALAGEMARGKLMLPESGTFASPEEFDGALIAGPADVIISEVRRYQSIGVEHMVFDLRQRFHDWEECLAFLGEEVLPELHAGDGGRQPS